MTSSSHSVREALAVLSKDLRSEFRTRHAISSLLLFAITSLAVVSFSVSPYSLDADAQGAFLWIVLFFSAMSGLSRSFVKEEESHTVMALRLAASSDSVYIGKLLFNIVIQAAAGVIAAPLFLLLMDIRPAQPGLFAASVALGTIAMASSSTIIAAMISRANSKGALFAVLAFPISLPGLASAIRSTSISLRGGQAGAASGDIRILLAYSVLMIAASLLLFDFVWND
ncbi:MAG: heme exporter protein CcmB [Clostridia bacterium]|nr:heme exporter protein CcmB [Clostridia bacterium]